MKENYEWEHWLTKSIIRSENALGVTDYHIPSSFDYDSHNYFHTAAVYQDGRITFHMPKLAAIIENLGIKNDDVEAYLASVAFREVWHSFQYFEYGFFLSDAMSSAGLRQIKNIANSETSETSHALWYSYQSYWYHVHFENQRLPECVKRAREYLQTDTSMYPKCAPWEYDAIASKELSPMELDAYAFAAVFTLKLYGYHIPLPVEEEKIRPHLLYMQGRFGSNCRAKSRDATSWIKISCASLNYLNNLGYTDEEIKGYSERCNEHVALFLAENAENVSQNMRYLSTDFDKSTLLILSASYPDAFATAPEVFQMRMCMIKDAFPNAWDDIINKQLLGYSGVAGANYQPIMRTIGAESDSYVEEAIKQLQRPTEIIFEFMVLLKNAGLDIISPEYCYKVLWPKDVLGDLYKFGDTFMAYGSELFNIEVGKFEILENVKQLLMDGFASDMVAEIVLNAWYSAKLPKNEFKKRLQNGFGDDYVTDMTNIRNMSHSDFLQKLRRVGGNPLE